MPSGMSIRRGLAIVDSCYRTCARQVGSCKLRPDPLFVPFVYHEGVEPTNNLAERTIRPCVVTRKISYSTRSAAGQVLRARLLTVSQTCRLQDRNSLEFLVAAIRARREGLPAPSLLPQDAEDEERTAA